MQEEPSAGNLTPRSKTALHEAEEYLRDKLRNSFHKVIANCERLDTLQTGLLDSNVFRGALARSFACRLTQREWDAFHVAYHGMPKRWVRLEERPIDLKKVRALFEDMVGSNDLRDPKVLQEAKEAKAEAEKYVKEQLRLNYKAIFRCFRALDLEGKSSLPLEQFRRVLSRYGGIRFTPKEWWGFTKLVDTDGDGRISLDEFEALFKNFDDGTAQALSRQLGDTVDVAHVERMIAQSFADRLKPMQTMIETMDFPVIKAS